MDETYTYLESILVLSGAWYWAATTWRFARWLRKAPSDVEAMVMAYRRHRFLQELQNRPYPYEPSPPLPLTAPRRRYRRTRQRSDVAEATQWFEAHMDDWPSDRDAAADR